MAVTKTTVRGWIVEWKRWSNEWRPDSTPVGDENAIVRFRKLSAAVLPSRKLAREELKRCRAEWAKHVRTMPKHRVRRATVTLAIED